MVATREKNHIRLRSGPRKPRNTIARPTSLRHAGVMIAIQSDGVGAQFPICVCFGHVGTNFRPDLGSAAWGRTIELTPNLFPIVPVPSWFGSVARGVAKPWLIAPRPPLRDHVDRLGHAPLRGRVQELTEELQRNLNVNAKRFRQFFGVSIGQCPPRQRGVVPAVLVQGRFRLT